MQLVELRKKQAALQDTLLHTQAEQEYLEFLDDRISKLKNITGDDVWLQEQKLVEQECANNEHSDNTNMHAADDGVSTGAFSNYVTRDMLVAEVQKDVAHALSAAGGVATGPPAEGVRATVTGKADRVENTVSEDSATTPVVCSF